MRFLDEHQDRRTSDGLRWGVEPICQLLTEHQLAIAPATYYAARSRAPSARAVRDAGLKPLIATVPEANYGVYGARKLHAALRRDGLEIGRDQTGRLMRELGLAGVRRGKPKRTTVYNDASGRPADLINRNFSATRPDQLWVADLTYLRTLVGFAHLALVIDVFSRRIVGWALAGHMRTELPLEALKLAVWTRRQPRLKGLVQHSDAGSQGGFDRSSQHLDRERLRWDVHQGGQPPRPVGRPCGRRAVRRWLGYLAIRYADALSAAGAVASVGSVGDSYNALAESTTGQLKAELVHRRGPWRTIEQLELLSSSTSTGGTTAASTARSA